MKISVSVDRPSRFTSWLLSLMRRRLTIGFLAIAMSLSGCVKYDTGIYFSSLSDGEIIEHIQLSAQLNSFSQTAVQTWLMSIEQRTLAAQGRLERLNDREFQVMIPFANPQELVTKINHYFNPNLAPNDRASLQLKALMQIDQSNFLVVIRNHLTYDIDLRFMAAKPLSKPTDVTNAGLSIGTNDLVNLNFSIQSLWGIKNISSDGNSIGSQLEGNKQMSWQLKPGQINHINAVFWLPNPLGIGAILITAICAVGYYFKYRQLPWQIASKID
jgi:Protein of unknown function (DUF3153)